MSGYAVARRVGSAKAEVAVPGSFGRAGRDVARPCAAPRLSTAMIVTGPDDERGSAMFGARVRWRAARDRWSQLTFYLFDPDSWR